MPRPLDIADLLLPLNEADDAPLNRQLYRSLRDAILRGDLRPGARLPSSRRLAGYLAVSRTTVLGAFDQLVAEGLIVGTTGSGTRVSDRLAPTRARRDGVTPAPTLPVSLSRRSRGLLDLPRPERRPSAEPKAFRTGQPPVDAFPVDVWRRLSARCLRRLSTADLYHGPAQGLRSLREGIVTLAVARGIRCEARQVLVMASAQEAIELACRMLLDAGDAAWLEDPGWSGAHAALLAAGARVVPVPVDGAGLQIDLGVRSAPRAKLAYVTPSHQYPTGVTLSPPRRRRLLDWAASNDAWILEDDYDSEFRYADRPLPALHNRCGADRVIYVGTFNKTLFPALRLAYLILPDRLVDAFRQARGIGGQHAAVIDQAVLSDFIADGHYGRHLARARTLGRERRDALISLAGRLDGLAFTQSRTGLHTVGWLAPGTDDRLVSALALRHGVEAAAISASCLGPCPRPGLVLGYGSLTTGQIADGVERLAAALQESRSGASAPGPT
jgi:GntR family transcriptional regulator/MocR family aminotransferase